MLTVLQVKNLGQGKHLDSRGLYLRVAGKSRTWFLRVQKDGRRRDVGLGAVAHTSLAEAREAADAVRKMIREGIDPAAPKTKLGPIPTFKEAARMKFDEMVEVWTNERHQAQWWQSLETVVFSKIGRLSVADVSHSMVRDLLVPIWVKTPSTGRRILQRIASIIAFSAAKEWRDSALPVDVIKQGLTPHKKRNAADAKHHDALDWEQTPSFIQRLRGDTISTEAMILSAEFGVLTCTRSREYRETRWSEIDLDAKLWQVPASRMKTRGQHDVPLSDRCIAILMRARELGPGGDSDLVFPGRLRGIPTSSHTLLRLVKRADRATTSHGMRSAFKDWAMALSADNHIVSELCLAHSVGDAVTRAYFRGDLKRQRRELMDQWSRFVTGEDATNNVLPMRRRA